MAAIVKICPHHGLLQRPTIYIKYKSEQDTYFYVCRICKNLQAKKEYHNNPRRRDNWLNYRISHPIKSKLKNKKNKSKNIKNLSRPYILDKLKIHGESRNYFPEIFIELKRIVILLRREISRIQDEENKDFYNDPFPSPEPKVPDL